MEGIASPSSQGTGVRNTKKGEAATGERIDAEPPHKIFDDPFAPDARGDSNLDPASLSYHISGGGVEEHLRNVVTKTACGGALLEKSNLVRTESLLIARAQAIIEQIRAGRSSAQAADDKVHEYENRLKQTLRSIGRSQRKSGKFKNVMIQTGLDILLALVEEQRAEAKVVGRVVSILNTTFRKLYKEKKSWQKSESKEFYCWSESADSLIDFLKNLQQQGGMHSNSALAALFWCYMLFGRLNDLLFLVNDMLRRNGASLTPTPLPSDSSGHQGALHAALTSHLIEDVVHSSSSSLLRRCITDEKREKGHEIKETNSNGGAVAGGGGGDDTGTAADAADGDEDDDDTVIELQLTQLAATSEEIKLALSFYGEVVCVKARSIGSSSFNNSAVSNMWTVKFCSPESAAMAAREIPTASLRKREIQKQQQKQKYSSTNTPSKIESTELKNGKGLRNSGNDVVEAKLLQGVDEVDTAAIAVLYTISCDAQDFCFNFTSRGSGERAYDAPDSAASKHSLFVEASPDSLRAALPLLASIMNGFGEEKGYSKTERGAEETTVCHDDDEKKSPCLDNERVLTKMVQCLHILKAILRRIELRDTGGGGESEEVKTRSKSSSSPSKKGYYRGKKGRKAHKKRGKRRNTRRKEHKEEQEEEEEEEKQLQKNDDDDGSRENSVVEEQLRLKERQQVQQLLNTARRYLSKLLSSVTVPSGESSSSSSSSLLVEKMRALASECLLMVLERAGSISNGGMGGGKGGKASSSSSSSSSGSYSRTTSMLRLYMTAREIRPLLLSKKIMPNLHAILDNCDDPELLNSFVIKVITAFRQQEMMVAATKAEKKSISFSKPPSPMSRETVFALISAVLCEAGAKMRSLSTAKGSMSRMRAWAAATATGNVNAVKAPLPSNLFEAGVPSIVKVAVMLLPQLLSWAEKDLELLGGQVYQQSWMTFRKEILTGRMLPWILSVLPAFSRSMLLSLAVVPSLAKICHKLTALEESRKKKKKSQQQQPDFRPQSVRRFFLQCNHFPSYCEKQHVAAAVGQVKVWVSATRKMSFRVWTILTTSMYIGPSLDPVEVKSAKWLKSKLLSGGAGPPVWLERFTVSLTRKNDDDGVNEKSKGTLGGGGGGGELANNDVSAATVGRPQVMGLYTASSVRNDEEDDLNDVHDEDRPLEAAAAAAAGNGDDGVFYENTPGSPNISAASRQDNKGGTIASTNAAQTAASSEDSKNTGNGDNDGKNSSDPPFPLPPPPSLPKMSPQLLRQHSAPILEKGGAPGSGGGVGGSARRDGDNRASKKSNRKIKAKQIIEELAFDSPLLLSPEEEEAVVSRVRRMEDDDDSKIQEEDEKVEHSSTVSTTMPAPLRQLLYWTSKECKERVRFRTQKRFKTGLHRIGCMVFAAVVYLQGRASELGMSISEENLRFQARRWSREWAAVCRFKTVCNAFAAQGYTLESIETIKFFVVLMRWVWRPGLLRTRSEDPPPLRQIVSASVASLAGSGKKKMKKKSHSPARRPKVIGDDYRGSEKEVDIETALVRFRELVRKATDEEGRQDDGGTALRGNVLDLVLDFVDLAEDLKVCAKNASDDTDKKKDAEGGGHQEEEGKASPTVDTQAFQDLCAALTARRYTNPARFAFSSPSPTKVF
eukprot:jgi/Bigna1/131805/aug1.15_g6513